MTAPNDLTAPAPEPAAVPTQTPSSAPADAPVQTQPTVPPVGISKNEFIRHELKTPIGSIKGYISMLEEGDYGALTLTPDQQAVLGKIKGDLDALTDKINTLLAD